MEEVYRQAMEAAWGPRTHATPTDSAQSSHTAAVAEDGQEVSQGHSSSPHTPSHTLTHTHPLTHPHTHTPPHTPSHTLVHIFLHNFPGTAVSLSRLLLCDEPKVAP